MDVVMAGDEAGPELARTTFEEKGGSEGGEVMRRWRAADDRRRAKTAG